MSGFSYLIRFRPNLIILALAFVTAACKPNGDFRKDIFLKECDFNIEELLLSDEAEYNEMFCSGRWRDEPTISLYEQFHKTKDYDLNLKICRSFGSGYFLRDRRGRDSLLIDNFFAHAIQRSEEKDVIIDLILRFAWDKPYNVQKRIGEACLNQRYDVSDSLKYVALGYAIDGNYYDSKQNWQLISSYCKYRMKLAALVFGKDSPEAYNALFECAQLTQIGDIDSDAVDSLFRFHKQHDKIYRNGGISDIFSDPLYMRYITSLQASNISYARELLDMLTNIVMDTEDSWYQIYGESKLLLMYENAGLRYIMNDPSYSQWIDKAIELSYAYLSPAGGYNSLSDYLKPNFKFYRSIVDLLPIAYNSPDPVKTYDIALFTKGTSSRITSELISTIMEYGDNDLVAYVDSLRLNYVQKYLTISEAFESVFDERDNREQYYTTKLNNVIANLNPEDIWRDCIVQCSDVIRELKENESAIEFIKKISFEGKDVYSALVLNYGDKKPICIDLCSGKDLADIVSRGNIYRNDNHFLFDLIIGPLKNAISGKTIFVSSTGLLSLINVSALSDGEGHRVSDLWNILNCSSTKTLIDMSKRANVVNNYSSIALFGGLEYSQHSTRSHFSNNGTITRDIERDGFGVLPASKKEVSKICEIAVDNNLSVSLFSGLEGTETEFRSLSSKDFSIIHLATHGFYYNTTEVDKGGCINLIGRAEEALNRCGLVFSNGNEAWLKGIDPMDDRNGIVLGSEIARMNLTNTDLVVLSACNTGLGEIDNEGISGLQTAFKKAGVKTILMTLKPISDQATERFMTEFYRQLFNCHDKYMAFNNAVKYMQSIPEFSTPDYWASYILLD